VGYCNDVIASNNLNYKIYQQMKLLWKTCRAGVIILSILIFTPLVTPKNIFTPEVFGLPYTLWMGILVYIFFVAFILLGIWAHSNIHKEGSSHD
jgi:hypothetical protein